MSSNRRASLPVNGLRRSPRRRTKTPSVNDLSKKFKMSPRGKRKLEFQNDKPLRGQSHYLDLQGYRKISSLQARIRELGGTVEEFLSKDISCVVTNKKDVETHCSPRSNSTPSPILSIPSPFPGNTKSSSVKGSAVPSPLSADSGGAEQTGSAAGKHSVRGKALAAQAAITCKYGSSNVIANARNWGVEIVQLEDMLKRLECYGSVEKRLASKPLVSGRVAKQGTKPKVRKLYAPFIKVEDHSRCYKPLVHELKEWPKIYFDGPLGSCPFDSPKNNVDNHHGEHNRMKRKPVREDKNKKKGYCECCCIHYEDLDLHLLSDRHQSFARDSSNYRSLDELIKKGPSIQDFLAKMLQKHEQKEKENLERSGLPSPGKSSSSPGKQTSPPKENGIEISPDCHTPDNGADCYTPTNPSPEKKDAVQTPTHSSSEKTVGDDSTPTRVLRSRTVKNDEDVVESRELSSSPKTLREKVTGGKELRSSARNKVNEGLRLEETSDEVSEKQRSYVKRRSTSSSPVIACSPRDKGASRAQEELFSQSPVGSRAVVGKKKSPVHVKEVTAEESLEGVRTRRSQQDSSDENGSKENYDSNSVVDTCGNEAAGAQDHVKRLKLRSETTRVVKQQRENDGADNGNRVESQTVVEEKHDHQLGKDSPRRASLRLAAKASPVKEVKNSELPEAEEGTITAGKSLERSERSVTQSSTTTAKRSSGDSNSISEKRGRGVSFISQQVTMETEQEEHMTRLTRSRVHSASVSTLQPCDNVGDMTASDAPSVVTQESTGEQEQESHKGKRREGPQLSAAAHKVGSPSFRENNGEAARNDTTSFSHKVKIKLSDCRQMYADRKRAVLEKESDESETESIHLSAEENLSPSKDVSSNKISSKEDDDGISSTPTISYCPSSPSSDKSGYSYETGGYSLRRRSQQEEEPSVGRRTRSNYKVPDDESKNINRKKSVPASPFTDVKDRSPKQRCQSVKSRSNNTPEGKKRKIGSEGKSPLKITPRRKDTRLKDSGSESDCSAFSGSPRGDPTREARGTRADLDCALTLLKDKDNAKAPSVLSESTISLGDVSTVAVCGTPRSVEPADCVLLGSCSQRKELTLSGTKVSSELKYQSAGCSAKDRDYGGINDLFDSDGEEEDFYGFHVPHFDGSFSSEGDFSYKISSIVERIDCGGRSQDSGDDLHDTTLQEVHEDEHEAEISKGVSQKGKITTGGRKMNIQEKVDEKIPDKSKESRNDKNRKNTVKRKSASQSVSGTTDAKRARYSSRDAEPSINEVHTSLSSAIGDGGSDGDEDENDDVFSSVSDSSDGEEDVGSPLSITSWRQKRKSEDLQLEVDRPTKRQRSYEQWSGQMVTDPSFPSSKCGTPQKSWTGRGISELDEIREEITEEKSRSRVSSFSSIEGSCEFYYSEEPVFQTLEERVKLRQKRSISRKALENSSKSTENQGNRTNKPSGRQAASAAKKNALPSKHVSLPQAASKKAVLPLEPLKDISAKSRNSSRKTVLPLKPSAYSRPIRASVRQNRANSSPSFKRSPLVTPFGKPRRPTWIYDATEFSSPPSDIPSVGSNRVTCSTRASSKRSLRSQLKEKDVFAFDE